MTDSIKNSADIYRQIVEDILDFRFSLVIDNILGTNPDFLISRWKQYIDYYEKIKEIFRSTIISENQYLREIDLNSFYRKYLELFDKSVEYSISLSYQEAIQPILETQEEWKKYNELPENLINENSSMEHINQVLSRRQEKLKEHRSKYDAISTTGKEIVRRNTNVFIHYHFDRFWELFKKCESPLEQAFFIGLFSYDNYFFIWSEKEQFDNQVQVGKYRLDFVVYDIQNPKTRLDIEVDGHNFHEKTEDQAVNDRVRDRELQKQGWDILRFHRKELELGLKSCIDQVMSFIEIKRQHIGRGK